jgi:C4-dicarboxylate transporter DctQ subunit
MCFRFLQVAVGFMKTGEVPHANHHVAGVDDAAIEDADFETEEGKK